MSSKRARSVVLYFAKNEANKASDSVVNDTVVYISCMRNAHPSTLSRKGRILESDDKG